MGIGPYELKRLKKGPQTESIGDEVARATVKATHQDPERVIPIKVPLVETVRGSPVATAQQGVGTISLSEPTKDRIR